MNPNDVGILIIDKPQGRTSHDVVHQVKKTLQVRKAGHTGTLDPLATGVLPVALGEATKIVPFLDESRKVYQVKGKLGVATDTDDADGQPIHSADATWVTSQQLEERFSEFLGKISQTPPQYSAIKVQGRPLYRYARRGEEVSIPARHIEIFHLELVEFENPYFTLLVHCSRGTYVRSLVRDLGQTLGCFAHVTQLRRLQTGPFKENQALPLSKLQPSGLQTEAGSLKTIEDCLAFLPALHLESKQEAAQVLSGVPLYRLGKALLEAAWVQQNVTLQFQQKILAVIQGDSQGKVHYQRVLNRK